MLECGAADVGNAHFLLTKIFLFSLCTDFVRRASRNVALVCSAQSFNKYLVSSTFNDLLCQNPNLSTQQVIGPRFQSTIAAVRVLCSLAVCSYHDRFFLAKGKMSWFSSDSVIEITNDFDANDAILYVLFLVLVFFLIMSYGIRKCKRLERRIESARSA